MPLYLWIFIGRIYVFFFSIQNIKSNCSITFLKIFPIIFFWWKITPSQLYLLIKGLIFVILCGSFFISSWFNVTATAYWKHLLSFLLMGFIVFICFLSNQENLYIIHHDLDLFYDIYNTITRHNWRQTHYLSSILNYFDIYFLKNQKIL